MKKSRYSIIIFVLEMSRQLDSFCPKQLMLLWRFYTHLPVGIPEGILGSVAEILKWYLNVLSYKVLLCPLL